MMQLEPVVGSQLNRSGAFAYYTFISAQTMPIVTLNNPVVLAMNSHNQVSLPRIGVDQPSS